MCGLIGWAGKDPKKFNKDKFNILGILNETRGTDSCGVTSDGEIYFGLKSTSKYRDFLAKSSYNLPNKIPTVFGHTRNSSKGSITEDNVHPFGFGSIKNKKSNTFEFVGAHNGTLRNEDELAKEYNIDNYLNKIDSQILLEIIYKSQNFKVLSQYIGGAALLFSNLNEPNVIYAFHGASSLYKSGTKMEEERPLFYYKKGKNDLYISSLEDSLAIITDNEEEVKNIKAFETNKVYKITDGDVDNAEIFDITRNKCHQKEYYNYQNSYTTSNYNKKETKKETKKDKDKTLKLPFKNNNVMEEKVYEKSIGGSIYYENLRYKRNGHLVEGVFCYIKDFGFYKLGETQKEAEKTFYDNVNKVFNKKSGYFTNQTVIVYKDDVVPFIHNKENEIVNPPLFYIKKGILLKDSIDYETLLDDNHFYSFGINQLSHCSEYPICVYNKKGNSNNIFFEGNLATGTINPLGSDRIYKFNNGSVQNIETIDKEIYSVNDLIKKQEKEIEEIYDEDFKQYFILDVIQNTTNSLVPCIEEYKDLIETYEDINLPEIKKLDNLVIALESMSNNILTIFQKNNKKDGVSKN